MIHKQTVKPTAPAALVELTSLAQKRNLPIDVVVKKYIQDRFLYRLSRLPVCQSKMVLQGYTQMELKLADSVENHSYPYRDLNFYWIGPSEDFVGEAKKVIKKICAYCEDWVSYQVTYAEAVHFDVDSVQMAYMQDYSPALRVSVTAHLAESTQQLVLYIEQDVEQISRLRAGYEQQGYTLQKCRKQALPVVNLYFSALVDVVSRRPRLAVYSLEKVLAEKYYAFYNADTVRLKDVYDCYFILSHYSLDKLAVQQALSDVFYLNQAQREGAINQKLAVFLQGWKEFVESNQLADVPLEKEDVCHILESV